MDVFIGIELHTMLELDSNIERCRGAEMQLLQIDFRFQPYFLVWVHWEAGIACSKDPNRHFWRDALCIYTYISSQIKGKLVRDFQGVFVLYQLISR